jgi:hypothetical protein
MELNISKLVPLQRHYTRTPRQAHWTRFALNFLQLALRHLLSSQAKDSNDSVNAFL